MNNIWFIYVYTHKMYDLPTGLRQMAPRTKIVSFLISSSSHWSLSEPKGVISICLSNLMMFSEDFSSSTGHFLDPF